MADIELVIKIPEEIYEIAKQGKWKWPADDVYKAIKNGTPLPKDATNGDVIKAIFPNGKVVERDEATGYEQMIDDKYSYCSWFDGIWWRTPYKAKSEDK